MNALNNIVFLKFKWVSVPAFHLCVVLLLQQCFLNKVFIRWTETIVPCFFFISKMFTNASYITTYDYT